MHQAMGDLKIGGMAIRYSRFVPQLYNYCLSLGFKPAWIMPSRAFCSDESQGYPIILIARHFGAFPFDHGQVGGRVATDRHGPHAHHGEDLMLVHASHVGYDPDTRRFGVYRRPHTLHGEFGSCCGKLAGALGWYQREYAHACSEVRLGAADGTPAVFIDNVLLDQRRAEGLFLHLDQLIDPASPQPIKVLSTSKAFASAPALIARFADVDWRGQRQPIGERLGADLFTFRRAPGVGSEGLDLLEEAIAPAMPQLVTSANPMLDAARYHTQIEFDRAYRSLQYEPAYEGKNLLFVSGLNVDVSPREGQLFPLTKFVPWAAYGRLRDGREFLLEQDELHAALTAQPVESADEIAFDSAIRAMAETESIELPAV
ncbi:MAG: hypothetical protein JO303_15205 [Caulobacteraceae bacterium]|nr:hypothetical protein [Caulobacteraceae bacterium]